MKTLTLQRLLKVLSYDAESGVFVWKEVSEFSNRKVGDVAGSKNKLGRIIIKIDGEYYYASRLAWLYVTGNWPIYGVDHKNGIKSDNRFDNLRDAPTQINAENKRTAQKNNKSGLMGVCTDGNGRYRARITINYAIKCLGSFDTPEQAHEAFLKAKRELHSGCTI